MNFSQKYLFWTNFGDIIYQVKTNYHHRKFITHIRILSSQRTLEFSTGTIFIINY
jgi:hypothetical protein